MAPLCRLIKDVERNNKPCLKLRVVRRFYRTGADGRENRVLEIVFHDQEGMRMTGLVKRINLPLFENRFVEGRVYVVKNYYLENNNGKYLTSLAKHRLIVHAKTLLIELPENCFFPDFMFEFRDFATLQNVDNVDETVLFDVIGKVNQIHNPIEKEFGGRRERLIEVVLEDNNGKVISCTLWGGYVDQLLAFEANMTAEPPIIILQMCRAKVYRDKVTLSNSFEVTQIHTHDTIPAIQQFKSQMPFEDVDPTKSVSRGTLSLSRMDIDELARGTLRCHSVDSLYTVDEGCSFWVCAIVASVIGDWWYLACTRCHRKLVDVGDEFHCEGCKKTVKSGVYRYKLQLEVLDSTANASVLLWDREAERLVGRSCHELRVEFIENRIEGLDIPDDLGKLIDRAVLFKVTVKEHQVHNESSVFTVIRLSTDQALVDRYNEYILEIDNNDADFLTLVLDENKNGGGSVSDDEVTTPIKKADCKNLDGDNSAVRALELDGDCIGSNSSKSSRKKGKTAEKVAEKVAEKMDAID